MKKQRLIKQKLAQECTSSLLCSDGCFFAFLLQLRLKLFCLPFEPTSLSHSIAQATLTLHKFSLGLGRTRAQRLCHGMVWPGRIEENENGCRFFLGGGGGFFVFQSGALFLAICYILEQKPVLCWILKLKCAIALFIDFSMALIDFSMHNMHLTCTWWTCRI